MIPNKSNTTNGCDNTSSNCVIWQGPDLPCVNVCNGDTISDIIAKMCEELVNTTTTSTGVDISTINQLCLEETYGVANDVQSLIQNIITEVCKVHSHAGTDPCSCIIPLPPCLQYTDEMGNTVTQLPLYDGKTGDSYAVLLANKICQNINAIDQIQNTTLNHEGRIVALEQRPAGERYIAPKVVPSFVATPGRPEAMEKVLRLTEESLGELRNKTGAPEAISTALNVAPNLNDRDRLSGKGTMTAISQWNVNPVNMAQSFQNLWITMNDTRNAVQSIKETVASPLCADVELVVKGSVLNNNEGGFSRLQFDFTGCTIPTGYTACDSRGTKLTITDSSLNSKVVWADIVNVYKNQGTFDLNGTQLGNIDTSSNFSVRVDFCVSNGDNQCQEIYNFTVDNELTCPNLIVGSVTADSAPFTVTNISIPTNKGNIISVNLRTSAGTLIDSRSYTAFGSGISGTFTNLTGSTQYQMLIEISRSGSSTPVQCAIQTFSTSTPSCTTTHIQPAMGSAGNWYSGSTAESNFVSGGNKLEIAAYNDGSGSLTKWTLGFDSTNQPIVAQNTAATGVVGWSHQGEFINNEAPDYPLAITDWTSSPAAPAGITRADKDSGWKYLGAIVTPLGSTLYAYASIDSSSKTVNDVVFACNCSGLYLNTPQPVFTCERGGSVVTTINAVGHSPSSSDFSWSVSVQPTHGTITSVPGYPTSTEQRYTYSQGGNDMAADSFTVSLSNDCGTVVQNKVVSILPAKRIAYTTSDIIVFFDATIMTEAAATDIKSTFNGIINGFSGDKPNIYYVPVQGIWAGDYLKHVKGCVERINGNQYWTGSQESITLATGGTWPSVASYPAWWSGSTNQYPPNIKIISFVNKMSSSTGLYASATTIPTVASWSGYGPTSSTWGNPHQYKEDYACISDMITPPTTAQRTIWTSSLQAISAIPWTDGGIPFTFDQVVVPIIADAAGVTATAALQQYAALQGSSLMTSQEVGGTKFGLDQFSWSGTNGINIAPYLDKNITGTPIPYSGTVSVPSAGTITIQGLKDLTSSSMAVHSYIEQAVDLDSTTNPKIATIFRGMFGLAATGSTGEPTSKGFGYIGGKGTLFGFSDVDHGSACIAANPGTISLFTAAGVDTSGGAADPFSSIAEYRAYLTPAAAARNVAGVEELTNNRWYAIAPGTGSVSYRAQYKTTAVAGKHWTNILQCT